jgi:hypothetical protein
VGHDRHEAAAVGGDVVHRLFRAQLGVGHVEEVRFPDESAEFI